jgi:hypothetical protein
MPIDLPPRGQGTESGARMAVIARSRSVGAQAMMSAPGEGRCALAGTARYNVECVRRERSDGLARRDHAAR